MEQPAEAPESSRHLAVTPLPVVFQVNLAVVLFAAAGGCVATLTVTPVLADGCST